VEEPVEDAEQKEYQDAEHLVHVEGVAQDEREQQEVKDFLLRLFNHVLQLDDADLAIIDKRRPRANEAQVMNLIGDVDGRTCIMVDDMVDTAGTLCSAAKALKERGATKVVAYCTHAVLSGKALENIRNSELDELVVTDSIPLSDEAKALNIRQLTISDLLAESIRRVSNEESISALFDE